MSIDLDQFHATFFEESFEALDAMEAALLKLDPSAPGAETINTIFRVAHSIKGGAGMFGFLEITSFTHTLETLLDEIRSKGRVVSQLISDTLLQSVDVLRAMMSAVQHGSPIDAARVSALHSQLVAIVGQPDATPDVSVAGSPSGSPEVSSIVSGIAADRTPCWHIRFDARPNLLSNGNDPTRLFAELEAFGPLVVHPELGRLPGLGELDTEQCVIAWDLYLTTAAPQPSLELIFEWALEDCMLRIEPHQGEPPDLPATGGAGGAVSVQAQTTAEAEAAPRDQSLSSPSATAARPAGTEPARLPATSDSSSIRVNIEKIDELLNTVGEIVITQSMLSQLAARLEGIHAERLRSGLTQLDANIRELQESVMRVRMLPVSSVFSRFPRVVRDLSQRLGKQIRLTMTGEQTELDKTVLEKIGDPLVHLVRNSIDHGIEMPEVRTAAGKAAEGTVHLHAFHKGGAITLEVSDDGKGLDKARLLEKARSRGLVDPVEPLSDAQIYDLIFLPGFSTAETTTELSGRGVGMDVVRRNIKELGGTIELQSESGKGTRFTINLPLTLAIVDGQSVAVGEEVYIVPLVTIIESLQLRPGMSSSLIGNAELVQFRGEYLPVIRVHEMFGVEPVARQLHEGLLMVVEGDGRRVGLFVDSLLGQQQVVIKSMESNYGAVQGVGGATILGEGTVALILDVPGLIRLAATRAATQRVA